MNILVVGQVFYPDNFRVNDVVKELAVNHKVKVITGLPDYDTGYVPQEYRWFKNRKSDYYGATIIRVPTISRRKGPLFRALNYISFAISGSIYALFLKEKYDVTFSYQTSPITMFLPAALYAKKNKSRSVIYTLDLWPESVKAMNIHEHSKIFKPIKRISKRIYELADMILISSPSFRQYLQEVLNINDHIEYLPQYTDEDVAELADVIRGDQIQDDAAVQFTFAGNLGLVQDIETVIQAVEMIPKSSNFTVNIVGSGSHEKALQEMVLAKGLSDYIKFLGRKNRTEMEEVYSKTDVCILTLKDEGFIGKTIPGKVQTYMAKGKPIVGAISGDAQEVIKKAECGLITDSGNYSALAENMQKYIENRELIRHHALNSIQYYLDNFNKENFMSKLTAYLEGRE